jgi:hypothetical protein
MSEAQLRDVALYFDAERADGKETAVYTRELNRALEL